MRDTTARALIEATADLVAARPNIIAAGVKVWTADPGPDAAPTIDLVFWGSTSDSDWALSGEGGQSPKDESYEVLGEVFVSSGQLDPAGSATPLLHPTEYTIRQVRATAYGTYKEVADQLRANPGSGVDGILWANLHHNRIDGGPNASGGRWAQIQFAIRVRARI